MYFLTTEFVRLGIILFMDLKIIFMILMVICDLSNGFLKDQRSIERSLSFAKTT
jgi:hypothetical protein